jgi:hypothetical protein
LQVQNEEADRFSQLMAQNVMSFLELGCQSGSNYMFLKVNTGKTKINTYEWDPTPERYWSIARMK